MYVTTANTLLYGERHDPLPRVLLSQAGHSSTHAHSWLELRSGCNLLTSIGQLFILSNWIINLLANHPYHYRAVSNTLYHDSGRHLADWLCVRPTCNRLAYNLSAGAGHGPISSTCHRTTTGALDRQNIWRRWSVFGEQENMDTRRLTTHIGFLFAPTSPPLPLPTPPHPSTRNGQMYSQPIVDLSQRTNSVPT